MPASMAASISANASSRLRPCPNSSGAEPMPPKFPHPSATRGTVSSERPSGRRSIGSVALINASLTAARRALATVASMPVLEARGIVKTLGAGRAERRILNGVDLAVDAGEVVAVLGRSGSGKSTLLHLLGGLDRPDAGQIVLADRDITKQSPRALARTRLRHVGFVFQSFHLIEELSGEENVLMPARLPGAGRDGERRGRRLIDDLGLSKIADRRPHELSGGEQQRFAIARALVNDPEVVLADEPTGNLDQKNGAAVLALLRELTGRAVVLVTHEPEAAATADRVLQLGDGHLHGTPHAAP